MLSLKPELAYGETKATSLIKHPSPPKFVRALQTQKLYLRYIPARMPRAIPASRKSQSLGSQPNRLTRTQIVVSGLLIRRTALNTYRSCFEINKFRSSPGMAHSSPQLLRE